MQKEFEGRIEGVAALFKEARTGVQYLVLAPSYPALEEVMARLGELVDQSKCLRALVVDPATRRDIGKK